MSSKPEHDLSTAFKHRDDQARWKAERENATARLELAQIRERLALVLSQHEPVANLLLDRDDLRLVIDYIRTGVIIKYVKKGGEHE